MESGDDGEKGHLDFGEKDKEEEEGEGGLLPPLAALVGDGGGDGGLLRLLLTDDSACCDGDADGNDLFLLLLLLLPLPLTEAYKGSWWCCWRWGWVGKRMSGRHPNQINQINQMNHCKVIDLTKEAINQSSNQSTDHYNVTHKRIFLYIWGLLIVRM